MTTAEKLFLTISGLIGIRVTKDNFRAKLNQLQTDGTYNQKMKNELIVEIIMAIVELDEEMSKIKK